MLKASARRAIPRPMRPSPTMPSRFPCTRTELGRASLPPPAGADEAVTFDDAAGEREDRADGEIGGVLGQHVGRVGDANAARPRCRQVDGLVADAEAGDDLEARQRRHQGGIRANDAARRDAADAPGALSKEAVAIRRQPQFMDGESILQLRHQPGIERTGDKNLRPRAHGLRNVKSTSACSRSLFFCTLELPVMPMPSKLSMSLT